MEYLGSFVTLVAVIWVFGTLASFLLGLLGWIDNFSDKSRKDGARWMIEAPMWPVTGVLYIRRNFREILKVYRSSEDK